MIPPVVADGTWTATAGVEESTAWTTSAWSLGAVDVDLVTELGQGVGLGDGLDPFTKVLLAESDANPLVLGGEGRLALAVVTLHISS